MVGFKLLPPLHSQPHPLANKSPGRKRFIGLRNFGFDNKILFLYYWDNWILFMSRLYLGFYERFGMQSHNFMRDLCSLWMKMGYLCPFSNRRHFIFLFIMHLEIIMHFSMNNFSIKAKSNLPMQFPKPQVSEPVWNQKLIVNKTSVIKRKVYWSYYK